MSDHKIPLTDLEKSGLQKHGLPIGEPSQLSDAFRNGVKWGAIDSEALRSQVEQLQGRCADLESSCGFYESKLRAFDEYMERVPRMILRRQAEAVEDMADFHDEDCGYLECLRDDELKEFAGDCVREMSTNDMRDYAQRLRDQAGEIERGGSDG